MNILARIAADGANVIIACGADGYELPASYWAAPADSGDDPDVDDVHRCYLIIDFVQDPDAT